MTALPEDLDSIEAFHEREERIEAKRTLLESPRPMATILPEGGVLFESSRWLDRLYAGDRVVREKKPGVFDHLRSVGPWFVSVDEPPLSVLDGMTQTATLVGGFAEDPVVREYVEGGFGDAILYADDTSVGHHFATTAFSARLRDLVPGLPEVTFTNSGAEACEKALALCRQNAVDPERQRRVLAFEGSFHGRTLLALAASFNPKKREPFEMHGHEVTYVPYPTWSTPHDGEPATPDGWLAAAAAGRVDELEALAGADALLVEEGRALAAVHGHLALGEHFAAMVEPMQSEGGDRYATARFHRALRLLTRHHGVALIHDEVQTGFGLLGRFAWHRSFGLTDRDGASDGPDCVTFAKRAQVGVVMSRWPDPEPTSAHPASLVRGRIHAEMMADDRRAARVQEWVRPRLAVIADRFPDLVSHPRAFGYALAFDLPSTEQLMVYLGQRFWRGTVVFGAGSRTVRYRLSTTWGEAAVDRLFHTIRASLRWIEKHPGQKAPEWKDVEPYQPQITADGPNIRIRRADVAEREVLLAAILDIEARVYEDARRDTRETLGPAFGEDGVAVVAETRKDGAWVVVGSALGAPLEMKVGGGVPDTDVMRDRSNTLYSLAITVDPDYRGLGLGGRLKAAQLEAAAATRTSDGRPRYLHVVGRNRVGHTATMRKINQAYGAYEVTRITEAYDGEGEASYYRLPVGRFVVDAPASPASKPVEDFSGGLARPFAIAPPSLRRALVDGSLYGPTVTKLTVMNYVTPALVRGLEWVGAVAPANLPHLYLTSSRDETFDKSLRILRFHRTGAQVALGLDGGYVGHTTAAARSLSDPAVHRAGPAYYDRFVRVPHPAVAGVDATVSAVRDAVESAGGPDAVLGLWVEPVQERTGRVVPASFWSRLETLREELSLPVVAVETPTACYRSGAGPFAVSDTVFDPDLLTWWAGGQTGFVHVAKPWFVPNPLTMVSTWDGDELCVIRTHHHLRAARALDLAAVAEALGAALSTCEQAGLEVRGAGLYRVIDAGDRAASLVDGLRGRGFAVRPFPNGCIAVVPPLDVDADTLSRFGVALGEVLG